MDQKRYFDFCTKRAQRLADYWAIHADIYESLQCICSYRALNDSESPDFLARKALSNAALLCYARSFVTGVRTRISEEATRGFTATELRHHLHLMEIRNKWIAHSVNDFETHQVKLEVACLPSGEMVPKKLLCGVQHPISLSSDEIGALEGLAEKVLSIVMDHLHLEEMLVLSSISAEDLARLKVDPSAFKCKESNRHPGTRRKLF